MMRVGIVGGGISGLSLLHYLDKHAVEALVFESEETPGGVIRTIRQDGHILELGPQRSRLSPLLNAMIRDLDLQDDVIRASDVPLFVYHSGKLRLVPRTLQEALTTDLLSWRGKLRALLEPLAGPPQTGESVTEYLTRAFGYEVAEYLAGPLYAGLYGSLPDEMPVEYSLAKVYEHLGVSRSVLGTVLWALLRRRTGPPVISFEAGLATLPEKLYERHRRSVELSTPVTDIQRRESGYSIVTDKGAQSFDAVVLTVPASVAAELMSQLAPTSSAALGQLRYNPLAVVHLYANTELEGAGFHVAYKEDFVIRGATWNASLLGRDGVYTVFLGGATDAKVVERSDHEIEQEAVEEFEAITGVSAQPLAVHRNGISMPAYDETWTAIEQVEMPDGIHLCANYVARAGLPGRVAQARQLAAQLRARIPGS